MNRPELLKWLLTKGFDVNAADEFGRTPLLDAAECGYAGCVATLLDAGADPGKEVSWGEKPIEAAQNMATARLLIAAGEDITQANAEVRRELTGTTGGDPQVSRAQYHAGRDRKFGRANPEPTSIPFWRAMVQAGCSAYRARVLFDDTKRYDGTVWCYDRFGRTTTCLPDGRILEIAGEHEDHYDPDFCIYNDVVVFDGKGGFEILGYPEKVFPPTDFHTATLAGSSLYIIGCLGYPKQRKPAETPVYRLDCRTFQIERIRTHGEKPGWISRHKAWYEAGAHRICISGGRRVVGQKLVPNPHTYMLDLKRDAWTRLPPA